MSDATTMQQLVASSVASFSNGPVVVGSLWLASSAVFTTYSTTAFLKYPEVASKLPLFLPAAEHDKSHDIIALKSKKKVFFPPLSQTFGSVTKDADRATLLTLFRFGGSFLLGLVFRSEFLKIGKRFSDTVHFAPNFALPALFLFVANYFNSIALNRVGVSLTYTSKCGIPLITVLFLFLAHGPTALPNHRALLSLMIIALGILFASWNSPTFEKVGFCAAMISTTSQAALNIVSKRAIVETGTTGIDAQRCMVAVAMFLSLGTTMFKKVLGARHEDVDSKQGHKSSSSKQKISSRNIPKPDVTSCPPLWLSVFAVTAYHVEYVLSFMFVRLVSPVTYGACDAVRRLAIIVCGKQMFGGPKFNRLNLSGIFLAILGALCYSVSMAPSK